MLRKLGRNDMCWCKSGRKYKKCHGEFDEKLNDFKRRGFIIPSADIIKNTRQIAGIRESGKINIAILDYVAENIRIGMSTEEIDHLVSSKTKELGGEAAPLGFDGYPKSVCTSINQEVCHGIPSDSIFLRDGDIVNVDVSTIYRGYFSDSSRMFCLGDVDEDKRKLVQVTKECIQEGLDQVKPWNTLGDMGEAVHSHALKNGFQIVKEIGGHGIGLDFHEDPFVSYVSKKGMEMLMVPGMVFTIEPMVNMGSDEFFIDPQNGWTAYTTDGKPSAQWEVTVLVTREGYEILAY